MKNNQTLTSFSDRSRIDTLQMQKHRRTIDLLMSRTGSIFKKLRKDHWIISFKENKEHEYDARAAAFYMHIECTLPNMDYSVIFNIRYELERPGIIISEKSKSRSTKLSFTTTVTSESIEQRITERIVQWRRGLRHEQKFKKFLTQFARELSRYGAYAYYAGQRKDRKEGIDFTCGFNWPSRNYEKFQFSFNLKSSDVFIKEHQNRYPNSSVFIFKEKDLSEPKKLKWAFARFAIRATREVTVGAMRA